MFSEQVEKFIKRRTNGDEDLMQEARIAAWQAGPELSHQLVAIRSRLVNLHRDANRQKRGGGQLLAPIDEDRDGAWQLDALNFKQQYPWLTRAVGG